MGVANERVVLAADAVNRVGLGFYTGSTTVVAAQPIYGRVLFTDYTVVLR